MDGRREGTIESGSLNPITRAIGFSSRRRREKCSGSFNSIGRRRRQQRAELSVLHFQRCCLLLTPFTVYDVDDREKDYPAGWKTPPPLLILLTHSASTNVGVNKFREFRSGITRNIEITGKRGNMHGSGNMTIIWNCLISFA